MLNIPVVINMKSISLSKHLIDLLLCYLFVRAYLNNKT